MLSWAGDGRGAGVSGWLRGPGEGQRGIEVGDVGTYSALLGAELREAE